MSFLKQAADLAKQAEKLAAEHKDQVDKGLAQAESLANKQTGGKYAKQLTEVEEKATHQVDNLKA